MIKIIATTATNHHLLELLKSAKQRIILVSPYIRLHREIYHALKKQREAGLQIDVICRATESEAQIPMLQEIATHIYDLPRLHAKCYLNESEAIVTSLNLHEFSQINNHELGILIQTAPASTEIEPHSLDPARRLFSEIKNEVERLIECGTALAAPTTPDQETPTEPESLVVDKRYTHPQLNEIFDFVFDGGAGIKLTHDGEKIALFWNTHGPFPPPVIMDGVLHYQGNNRGLPNLAHENLALGRSHETGTTEIHLFRDMTYLGQYVFVEAPYLRDGRWFFPLRSK